MGLFELNTITFDSENVKPNEEQYTLFHMVVPMFGNDAQELAHKMENLVAEFYQQKGITKRAHICISTMK